MSKESTYSDGHLPKHLTIHEKVKSLPSEN